MSTDLKYEQTDCKRCFTVIWFSGWNGLIYVHKKKREGEKYPNASFQKKPQQQTKNKCEKMNNSCFTFVCKCWNWGAMSRVKMILL